MPKFALPLILAAAAVLSVAAGAALGLKATSSTAPSGLAAALPDAAGAGEPSAQAAAVAAVRAHLQRGDAAPDLTDIQVLPAAGGFVVCAKLRQPAGDIVARVLPGSGTRYDAETREMRHVSRTMVVLEDGPGLWRGGGMGVARQRYCGGQRPGSTAEAAASATGPAQPVVQPSPAAPPDSVLAVPDGAGPAGGMVTVNSPVRVRSGPSGESEVLFIAERGREFSVHGHAPGGWVQIGDQAAASGWAHSSLLTMSP